MKYYAKKGIVLTSVGNQTLLVSAKSLHDQVPYVSTINETAAACWKLLENGCDENMLVQHFLDEYDVDDPDCIRNDIQSIITQFQQNGYIMEVYDE